MLMARRMQDEEDARSAASLVQDGGADATSGDAVLAALLQAAVANPLNDLDAHLADEKRRRIASEGPPPGHPDAHITTKMVRCPKDGTLIEERLQAGGRPWDEARSCVVCSDDDVRAQLRQLNGGSALDTPAVRNPANWKLLRFLCEWRKHVTETHLSSRPKTADGTGKWKTSTICASEQMWLGRSTAKGGIIGKVAASADVVDTCGKLDSLKANGGAGMTMLVGLRFGWDLAEKNAKGKPILKRLHGKGGPTWDLVTGKYPDVDPRVREAVLSRAHLP